MDENDRRQRREREQKERQQVQSVDREHSLFSEPRRVNPADVDDDITATLGDYSKVKDYINLYNTNRHLPADAVLPGIIPITVPNVSSLSTTAVSAYSSSQRLPPPLQPPPSHHYQQQQQQSRQPAYFKQVDNKPSYNGRGGYPGQPVKNDLRASSGMAPPKGPPPLGGVVNSASIGGASTMLQLPPPSMSHMHNGRQSASDKLFLGPPTSLSATHNGRFPQPLIPKNRQKPAQQEDISKIINEMTGIFRTPDKPLTLIGATPHTTIGENYNLNGPNKHKYAFVDLPPSGDTITSLQPLASPPLSLSSSSGTGLMPAPSQPPIQTFQPPPPQQQQLQQEKQQQHQQQKQQSTTMVPSLLCGGSNFPTANAASTGAGNVLVLTAARSKEPQQIKPLKTEKTVAPVLEKQNSTLENDLELSESDDDRRKQNRSALNSSDSSQSDSSESGSEESSKGEQQQKSLSHSMAAHHAYQTQQPLRQLPNAATVAAAVNQKKKISQTITAVGGITISGLLNSSGLGSAGSSGLGSGPNSTSSSNKTPSPSDSNKWNLSRYFNKAATQQAQNDASPSSVVNSMNVLTNVPTMLPGGAQIIPEPTPQQLAAAVVANQQPSMAIVKNEAIAAGDDKEDEDDDDEEDEDEEDCDGNISGGVCAIPTSASNDAFRHPSSASVTFAQRKAPQGLSVTPLSPLIKSTLLAEDIKKESADSHFSLPSPVLKGVPPILNDSQCVAIPIKREGAPTIAGGMTTVTPYSGQTADEEEKSLAPELRKRAEEFMLIEGLSGLSDTNSSDGGGPGMPMPSPGGTLQIPGVPAAITALPRSPPMLPHKPPTLPPNSLTVTPIDPFPASPQNLLMKRAKKPRKKIKASTLSSTGCDSSDEEHLNSGNIKTSNSKPGMETSVTKDFRGGEVSSAAAAKKRRGRPRKTTPSHSGNISSASSTAKGPTLTAKKEMTKKPTIRRRVSRQNSSSSATIHSTVVQDTTPNKLSVATKINHQQLALAVPVSLAQPKAVVDAASSDDSSSSSSSSYSTSKSSSSTSDSDANSGSGSSSEDEKKQQERVSTSTAESVSIGAQQQPAAGRRIVKQLNKRKSSLDDVVLQPKNAIMNATVGKKSGRFEEEERETSSSEEDSSAEEYVPQHPETGAGTSATPAQTTLSVGVSGGGGGGVSHRSQHQSPYKMVSSGRSRVSSSFSSASSSSSSDEEHSDSDVDVSTRKDKKLRRDKTKTDKNKISTLTRIFNPKEGGAKKQGQVVIIDQSEELLAKEQHKYSNAPNAAFKNSQENLALSNQNLPASVLCSIVAPHSPRLTPNGGCNMKSPRNLAIHAAQLMSAVHRTPDRCSSSAERKMLQRIKTPTRTPTRTPTPTPTQLQPTGAATASPARGGGPLSQHSLICKIDLSRLLHIAPEWHHSTYRVHGSHTPSAYLHYHHTGAGPPAGQNTPPVYDHESILNADLQTTQLRLKTSGGRHTSTQASQTHCREQSRSRECLFDVVSAGKQARLDELAVANGRLSSQSTDGCTVALKDQTLPAPPNGYVQRSYVTALSAAGGVSPTGKPLAGVKHEVIKYDPDAETTVATIEFCNNDTKLKTGVKQELIMKQDYKSPSDLDKEKERAKEKQKEKLLDVSLPVVTTAETKLRRKRSSSASSSPYKDKKRKKTDKDKDAGSTGTKESKELKEREGNSKAVDMLENKVHNQKEHLLLEQQLPPTNHERLNAAGSSIASLSNRNYDNSSSSGPAPHAAVNNNVVLSGSAEGAHMPPPSASTHPEHVVPPSPGTSSAYADNSNAANVALLSASAPATATVPPPPPPPAPQVIYRSYFERDDEALSDDFRNTRFLQEAVSRKRAADREQNTFNQVTLYLEAVVYFLLSGAAMEKHRTSEEAAWTMYKDTLTLIKFISTKFRYLQQQPSSNGQLEVHNKVAILSLRCQSLISLKLYKMKRAFCRSISVQCSDFFRSGGRGDIVNGNTPSSISPSNSVGSQGSGSNTPPGRIVPQDVHSALQQQTQFFNYLSSSHELWEQADRLVRQGNHTDFFIALDRENGPLTLHSSMYEVFHYVQSGLKKLREVMSPQ